MRNFYPDASQKKLPELKPYLSKIVKLSAGHQVDYIITPTESRKFTLQTLGNMDMVIVLFEYDAGNSIYLAGDDNGETKIILKVKTA